MYYQKTLDHNTFEEVEPLRKPLSPIQAAAVVLIPATAITAWILIFTWVTGKDTKAGYLDGLNWSDKVKNWHYVAMTGFFAFASLGMSAYRFLPIGKLRNKILHGFYHSGGVACFSVGLAAMLKSHNNAGMANLWSLHSWIG
jgi:hypothetical protein